MTERKHWLVGQITLTRRFGEPLLFTEFFLHTGPTPLTDQRPLVRSTTSRRIAVPLSQTQLEALKANAPNISNGSRTGFAEVEIDKAKKRVRWVEFYPMVDISKERETPRRTGLGTQVHLAMAELLANHFPGHTIQHAQMQSEARKSQLRKMGLNPFAEYPIKEYVQKIRKAVEKEKT